MRTLYFDGNNEVDVAASDDYTDEEDMRLSDWLSYECNHRDWTLDRLEIDFGTWTIYYHDDEDDMDKCMII